MKNKTVIFLLSLSCLLLMGCPPMSTTAYFFKGSNCVKSTSWHEATIVLKRTDTVRIRCGVFKDYSKRKEKGVYAQIYVNGDKELHSSIKNMRITSTLSGEIPFAEVRTSGNDSMTIYAFGKPHPANLDSLYTKSELRKLRKQDTINMYIPGNEVLVFTASKKLLP